MTMNTKCRNILEEREFNSKFLTDANKKKVLTTKYGKTLAKDFTKGYKNQPNFNIVIKCSVGTINLGGDKDGIFGDVSKDLLSFIVIGTDIAIVIMLIIFTDTLNRL